MTLNLTLTLPLSTLGIGAMLLAAVCSSFASVYFEKVRARARARARNRGRVRRRRRVKLRLRL